MDTEKTNVREKGLKKLIKGFSMYLEGITKNQPLDPKAEARFRILAIVCNIMCASGPMDKASISRAMGKLSELNEQGEDQAHSRRGIVTDADNPKTKKKVGTGLFATLELD